MTETTIAFTELLGRRVRMGTWEDQKVSTYRKILEALDEARWDDAAKLESLLHRRGDGLLRDLPPVDPGPERLPLGQRRRRGLIAARNDQAVEVARHPTARPWQPRRQWDRFLSEMQDGHGGHVPRAGRGSEASSSTSPRRSWRQCHDRDVDHTYALMSLVKEQLGETGHPRRCTTGSSCRSSRGATRSSTSTSIPGTRRLEVLMLVACEAMRGHLVGPERTGDLELIETEDRYMLRFDPCGSGQRTIRGDWIEGTPPRMEPPYDWTVVDGAGTRGTTTSRASASTACTASCSWRRCPSTGSGTRSASSTRRATRTRTATRTSRQKCQWQMYKDPTSVPEEYYTRVGRTKPTVFGSKAQGPRSCPSSTWGCPAPAEQGRGGLPRDERHIPDIVRRLVIP